MKTLKNIFHNEMQEIECFVLRDLSMKSDRAKTKKIRILRFLGVKKK